ncbi:MAG: formylglycine-generating enzyme family protein, partial [Chlorobiaceae bacterium]|nr:formylglycine-generating enzyme family protein [Chlorobiaceae bacterium]
KYPVTNRLYRRFIGYLKTGKLDGTGVLSVKQFRHALQAESNNGFMKGYSEFGKKFEKLSELFQSKYDDDKRVNGDEQPVVGITWYAARAYCLWLSLMESEGSNGTLYCLPTEKEWEYAAAGSEGRIYPWGSAEPTPKLANYGKNEGATTPVGSYPEGATPDGLYDIAGNVWEWMENWRDEPKKSARALRGGSWFNLTEDLRCSSRNFDDPDCWSGNVGFRVLRPSQLLKP